MVLFLDMRTAEEYASGHYCGAYNIPMQKPRRGLVSQRARQQVRQSLRHFLKGLPTSVPLYVYCHRGVRAQAAMEELQTLGYDQVVNMGGFDSRWGPICRDNK